MPRTPNCNFIVKDTPYWAAVSNEDGVKRDVLGTFDMCSGLYESIRYPENFNGRVGRTVLPVNLMDSVVAMVYSPCEEPNQMVDVYTLDESSGSWEKKFAVVPVLLNVLRLPRFFKNGEIVVEENAGEIVDEHYERKTFLFDPKTNCILDTDSTGLEAFKPIRYRSYSHVESLVYIKGMKPLGEEDNIYSFATKDTSKPPIKKRNLLIPVLHVLFGLLVAGNVIQVAGKR